MIQWLYRYIFKGLGLAMFAVFITFLYLAVMDGARYAAQKRAGSKISTQR